MDSSKDKLLEVMLKQSPKSSGPLIQDLTITDITEDMFENPSTSEGDGPSMMDMMMAAQAEAKKIKDKEKEQINEITTKEFGGGFKKGFFGQDKVSNKSNKNIPKKVSNPNSSNTNTNTTGTSTPTATPSTKKSSSPLPLSTPNEEIPLLRKNTQAKSSLVLDPVQEAMKSQNPMLQKLQQGEWVTPNLMEQFQSNPIISAGLSSPRCVTAMQLMQSDPAEAKRRFENDEVVSVFLREFGRLMSTHFEQLGVEQSQSQQQQQTSTMKGDKVSHTSSTPSSSSSLSSSVLSASPSEMGALQADAIRRAKDSSSSSAVNSEGLSVTPSNDSEVSDERVKEVLNDEELRGMLMDTELQRILSECNDPVLFQNHMRNPAIAKKVKRLFDAGLLGVAR